MTNLSWSLKSSDQLTTFPVTYTVTLQIHQSIRMYRKSQVQVAHT
jgi:hypothetical protein